jgi:hypothetical protein
MGSLQVGDRMNKDFHKKIPKFLYGLKAYCAYRGNQNFTKSQLLKHLYLKFRADLSTITRFLFIFPSALALWLGAFLIIIGEAYLKQVDKYSKAVENQDKFQRHIQELNEKVYKR